MTGSIPKPPAPSYGCHVFDAADLVAVAGANQGDALTPCETLCPGDVYEMREAAEALYLSVADAAAASARSAHVLRAGDEAAEIAAGTEIGQPGERLGIDGKLTLMAPDGAQVELLLVLLSEGPAARLAFLPLGPVEPRVGYALIRVDTAPGPVRLADITSVAFTRGTMIAVAGGEQRPIETLSVGDRLLTRDHGAQPLRWIGRRTVRGVGAYAPVVIAKGTLGNASDLIVSQHQRLFIYQRGRQRLTSTAEALVKAQHLVDGDTAYIRKGGFVEYFHLVFDRHEILYAEGIPTESLLVNEAMLGRMPEDLAREVARRFPLLAQRPHFGTEADGALLRGKGAAELRRLLGQS
ncbi:hypothetical protein Ga0609869_002695 [Rhodovulum iodosum]|uniref:Hedgehog/Intein (Hint) domain-containing protein n=1 Tax=Rhodovulum iodosum TaxID=68291 RepID=A0ABV3XYB1_9RHOB|nr:Hint domain-containing protein [Rhodovulum robiginosum]RSK33484.1 Hint domain-containing protein [Rhodovulum robiginosum]